MSIVADVKDIFDNIDKTIVTESNLYFSRGNETQQYKLTDDGIVEKYHNNVLQDTFPFSKLSIARECKSLVADGYTITLNENNLLNSTVTTTNGGNGGVDTEQIQADLEDYKQSIEDIQGLKDKIETEIGELTEVKEVVEKFPSTDFTSEPMIDQDINVETFNAELTSEQKAYINTYIGTIEEFVGAMRLLYDEVGDGVSPLISINDYVEELLSYNGGIDEWSQELSDMLGFDLKTESKSKFHTAENMFDDFLKTAKEDSDEDGYTFKLSDLGLTREDSAEFKNLLLQREEIDDVTYNPQDNTYTVKIKSAEVKDTDTKDDEKNNEEVK